MSLQINSDKTITIINDGKDELYFSEACPDCLELNFSSSSGSFLCQCSFKRAAGKVSVLPEPKTFHKDLELARLARERWLEDVPDDCKDEVIGERWAADGIFGVCDTVGIFGFDVCSNCPFYYAQNKFNKEE